MTTTTTRRRRYLFRDRATAEDNFKRMQDSNLLRGYMLRIPSDLDLSLSTFSTSGTVNPETYRVRVWLRPRSGFAWFLLTSPTCSMFLETGENLDTFRREWNASKRDTESGRTIGDLLERAWNDARPRLFPDL
jgi:hypothetical protein